MAGAIVNSSSLEQMHRTRPAVSFEGKIIEYGLGAFVELVLTS
ncbi:hypothetical protein AB0H58_06465 [Nocardia neocaledoniensis]